MRETNGLKAVHDYLPENLHEWATLLDLKRTFWFPTISEALHLRDWHDKEGTRRLDAQAVPEKKAWARQTATMRS